eukprot:7888295-Pyramimonas_sp.AAC.1
MLVMVVMMMKMEKTVVTVMVMMMPMLNSLMLKRNIPSIRLSTAECENRGRMLRKRLAREPRFERGTGPPC